MNDSEPYDLETVAMDEPRRINEISELSIGDEIVFARRSLSDEEIESKQPLRVVDGASKTQRVCGTVVDVAREEGYRLDHATTRDGSGYAELIPMTGDDNSGDDGEPVLMTDGGRDLPETNRECVRCDSDAVPGSRHCGEHSRLVTDGGVSEGDIRVADVTDRSKLRGELARLGHPVAEAHLLEEFDAEEVRR